MDTKKLRQKILDLAIRGKLVPQDPNDEPASVLLERIRAEKEQLIKAGKIKRSKQSASDKSHYENVPFEIPSNWEWVKLGDIYKHNTGKALNAKDKAGKLRDYITTSNLYWDKFDLTVVKQMLFTDNEVDRCSVTKGDLLVCEGGDIGRSAIWYYDYEICIQNHIHRLRGILPLCNKFYYYIFYYYKFSNRIGGKGMAIQGLSADEIDKLLIPLPSVAEQERIVKEIEKWFALISNVEDNKLDLQKAIKQTESKILSLAISGNLVSQDPCEEPAIELLKRIAPNIVPCDTSHYENLPATWQVTTLKDVAKTVSVREYQILQSKIQKEGLFPVVSQSANYIEGYSNQSEKVYKHETPVIVFGDHTRVVKYIDFDFIIGADGVKVIVPLVDSKYLYYIIQYASEQIKDRGYGRHFGYLSKYPIPIAPLVEQTRIVTKIEEIFNIIDAIATEL